MNGEKGLLIVLSGPSGVGKGTVCHALRQRDMNIKYSVSATTRAPRQGEKDGVNYFFKSKEAFQTLIDEGQLLEWAKYVDNYYGTPRSYVYENIAQGNDILLEIEVQGAMQVKQRAPEGIFIFLAPPSMEELQQRIQTRGTESNDVVQSRLAEARKEINMMEHYDYVVVNDEIEKACDQIEAIVQAEHCKKERKIAQYKRMIEEVDR